MGTAAAAALVVAGAPAEVEDDEDDDEAVVAGRVAVEDTVSVFVPAAGRLVEPELSGPSEVTVKSDDELPLAMLLSDKLVWAVVVVVVLWSLWLTELDVVEAEVVDVAARQVLSSSSSSSSSS